MTENNYSDFLKADLVAMLDQMLTEPRGQGFDLLHVMEIRKLLLMALMTF